MRRNCRNCIRMRKCVIQCGVGVNVCVFVCMCICLLTGTPFAHSEMHSRSRSLPLSLTLWQTDWMYANHILTTQEPYTTFYAGLIDPFPIAVIANTFSNLQSQWQQYLL